METLLYPNKPKTWKVEGASNQEQNLANFLRSRGFLVGQQHTITTAGHQFKVDFTLWNRNYPHIKVYTEFYGDYHYPQSDEEMCKIFEHDRWREKLINEYLESKATKSTDQRNLLILSAHRTNAENLAIILETFDKLYTSILVQKVVTDWQTTGELAAYRQKLQNIKLKKAV